MLACLPWGRSFLDGSHCIIITFGTHRRHDRLMKLGAVREDMNIEDQGKAGREGVIVIGGGVAGMTAALALTSLGHEVSIVERSDSLGGRAARLGRIQPQMLSCYEIIAPLVFRVQGDNGIKVRLSREVVSYDRQEGVHSIELDDGQHIEAGAIIIATGLDAVPAALVPEYGHGLRDGVLTAPELEERLAAGQPLTGRVLRSAVFVQCAGSRTERRGVPYCSALCCANSIKNALLMKQEDPAREVTVLYIDIRTAGRGQEALYREARKSGVRFIRGQPAMVTERDGRLLVCGENTLLRELYEIPADLVVLATGLRQSPSNLLLLDQLEVAQGTTGFPEVYGSRTSMEGLFIAGSAKGPMDLPATERDARACALDVHEYLAKGR